MGVRSSCMGSVPSHRARPPQHRRRTTKRKISSFFICGASSSTHQMGDYSNELLLGAAERRDGEKLKYEGNSSDLSLGSKAVLVDIKTENYLSCGRCSASNENPVLETQLVNVGPRDEEKCLSESRELVPCQSKDIPRVNDTSSTSCMDQPFSDSVHATELVNLDDVNESSSQIVETPRNLNSLPSHGRTDSMSGEVSMENNIFDAIDFSDSEYGFSSVVSESPMEFRLIRDDSIQEMIPSTIGFSVPEREQNMQERHLVQGDLMGASSNSLSSNSSDWSSHDSRRNGRRLFWDAFLRRSPRRDSISRGLLFPSDESNYLRYQDWSLLDVSGDSLSNERRGDIRSRGSRTERNSELRSNSRSETLERFRDGFGSNDLGTSVCPRRVHADGSCSCRSGTPTEESGSGAISRIVLLAQALFEVLDHIHRPPRSLLVNVAPLPAPESIIDSFPVKIHRKDNILKCTEDVSQCYICLSDYEEGDKIRVLPCHHEYHVSCVDKWLREFHGVCPLCRGDVSQGFTEAPLPNQEILSGI